MMKFCHKLFFRQISGIIFLLAIFILPLFAVEAQTVTGGAVGFRVLPNPEHLSPLDWYQRYIPPTKRGSPTALIIDGYEAVRDGRSIYISAAHLSSLPGLPSILYTNIYIFSYDSLDPDDKTKEIFEAIKKHLKFSNTFPAFGFGSCEISGATCSSDFDCPVGEECLNSAGDALRRDVKRAADLVTLNQKLLAFKNAFGDLPKLLAGSYLQGVSYSTWPSWRTTLSAELKMPLFTDPLNKFVCPDPTNSNIDRETCWNVLTQNFTCPNPGYAYLYEYDEDISVSEARGQFGANYETPQAQATLGALGGGLVAGCSVSSLLSVSNDIDVDAVPNDLDNCNNLNNPNQRDSDADGRGDLCDVCPFDAAVATNIAQDFDSDGICADVDNCPKFSNPNQTDLNRNGIGDDCETSCNDGVKNVAEDCDPTDPDPVDRGPLACSDPFFGGIYRTGERAVCNQITCKWDASACRLVGCGNLMVEAGEECDGNVQRESCLVDGYPGERTRVCNVPGIPNECRWRNNQDGTPGWSVCEPLGYCGDGLLQSVTTNPVGPEYCDTLGSLGAPANARCNTNCQSWSCQPGFISSDPGNSRPAQCLSWNGCYLAGSAWNTNIGWIKMDPISDGTGGVFISRTGLMDGYAWNTNAGWIDFGSNSLSEPRVEFSVNNRPIVGFATGILANFPGSINMNPTTAGVFLDTNTGNPLVYNLRGNAWSESVGWIDFETTYAEVTCVVPDCGNGVVEGREACDDGNEVNSDGCSGICSIEPGWGCSRSGGTAQTGVCTRTPTCGDGKVHWPLEKCDDFSYSGPLANVLNAVCIQSGEPGACTVMSPVPQLPGFEPWCDADEPSHCGCSLVVFPSAGSGNGPENGLLFILGLLLAPLATYIIKRSFVLRPIYN